MITETIKGLIIGVSMLIPGVSGGTVAIICGIYYELIEAVDTFFKDIKKNILILVSVALGGAIGVLLFSNLILEVYETYQVPMLYFFIGAVLGSVPLLFKTAGIKKVKLKTFIYPLIGILCILLLDAIPKNILDVEAEGVLGYIILFIISIFLATPLVLPGISFSYMLLILGLYEKTLTAIHTLNLLYLIPMCLGILIGIFITARIIRLVLRKYPSQTYLVIIGFVLASIKDIFPGVPQQGELIISLLLMIISFTAIYKISEKNI